MTAAVCGLGAVPSQARAAQVRISAPATLIAGKACRVAVTVGNRVRGTALLQERSAGRWQTVSAARLRRRSLTLRCPASDRAGRVRRFRALVRRDGRTIARSRTVSSRVVSAPGPAPPVATPGSPPAPPAPAPGAPGSPARPPLDPAQFGVEGTGGPPSPEALALLGNQRVVLDADGIADLRAGRIDPRIVAVLTKVSETYRITVSAMCSDHPKLTSGGSISNHYFGRGVDIAVVDGSPVNVTNAAALALTSGLSSLHPSYRPDEVGSPWAMSRPGYFTDADSQDKIHVAFKRAVDPGWTPPA